MSAARSLILDGVHCQIAGTGSPIVLLHGLASSHRIWDLVSPVLAQNFTVVAFDARGHGESCQPAGPHDFATMAGDVAAVCSSLQLPPATVVGHSWGASVALEVAARFPHVLTHLVLVDGGYLDFQGDPALSWEVVRRQLAPPHVDMSVEDFLAAMCAALGSVWRPELEPILLGHMRVEGGRVRAGLERAAHLRILRHMWEHNLAVLYPQIAVPTLLIHAALGGPGELDWDRLTQRAIPLMERLIPEFRVEHWDNTIHDIPLQHPERLADRIRRFATEADADPAPPVQP